jgi:glycoprotein-N-acetylgalactosamine 3-beta-galactosyltransferase
MKYYNTTVNHFHITFVKIFHFPIRYAVMDNMRFLLSSFDASTPLHLGFRYENPNNGYQFMSGGSGYVLTKESIRRFVEIGLANVNSTEQESSETGNSTFSKNSLCESDPIGGEDLNLGINKRN